MPITAEAVVAHVQEVELLAEREDFASIREMIDEHAYFRFNDGDFVGRPAIQAAFERTWRGDPTVERARFYLTDITVLTVDQRTGTATYTYNGEGTQGDRAFTVRGCGTRVLVRDGDACRIVHEHLSRCLGTA